MSYKAGFVAMVGLPNAGKSTLVNTLVGEKVSIISRKPQTTRQRVLGILTQTEGQVVFIDSPGHIKAEKGLNNFLGEELKSVIYAADVVVAVLNLDAPNYESLDEIISIVKNSGKPWVALINKTDLEIPHRLVRLRERLSEERVLVIEGAGRKSSTGIKEKLMPILFEFLPAAKSQLYETDLFTPHTTRELIAEMIREKCFEYLHQEIPYGLAVKVMLFKEEGKLWRIHADILVSKDSHVQMVIGGGGQTLKRIGASARIEAEIQFGHKIYLELFVKCRKNWMTDTEAMKELGYVVP